MNDVRADGLAAWARSIDPALPADVRLVPASDDASFRRYFRFSRDGRQVPGLVFVDAPPEHEDNESFVRISSALVEAGLNCPIVRSVDYDLGYMIVTDLGNDVYLDQMTESPAEVAGMYEDARAALRRMLAVDCALPPYDEERLRMEMSLFPDWFLAQQLRMDVSDDVSSMLEAVCALLVKNALEQPARFVHRDYHCRNLMRTAENNPGILDFQDALTGPVTYDLVSLYKDCYYRFPRTEVERVVVEFHEQLIEDDIVQPGAPMLRWFDLMGAQRHLKCAGIFSRLNLRDGKPGYLKDIPLVIDYLVEVADLYDELADFGEWLKHDVVPRLSEL